MPDVSHNVLHGLLPDQQGLPVDSLKRAVEARHSCSARFARSIVVWELLKGEIVEEHSVYVFDLEGLDEVPTAFAWQSRSRIFVVLQCGDVSGPAEAVCKAIVVDRHQSDQGSC